MESENGKRRVMINGLDHAVFSTRHLYTLCYVLQSYQTLLNRESALPNKSNSNVIRMPAFKPFESNPVRFRHSSVQRKTHRTAIDGPLSTVLYQFPTIFITIPYPHSDVLEDRIRLARGTQFSSPLLIHMKKYVIMPEPPVIGR